MNTVKTKQITLSSRNSSIHVSLESHRDSTIWTSMQFMDDIDKVHVSRIIIEVTYWYVVDWVIKVYCECGMCGSWRQKRPFCASRNVLNLIWRDFEILQVPCVPQWASFSSRLASEVFKARNSSKADQRYETMALHHQRP